MNPGSDTQATRERQAAIEADRAALAAAHERKRQREEAESNAHLAKEREAMRAAFQPTKNTVAAATAKDIAAEIEALLFTNETRIAGRGQSIARDLATVRQELDLIGRWIIAVTRADDGR